MRPAVDAYLAFSHRLAKSLADPWEDDGMYPADADFGPYSTYPARDQYRRFVSVLRSEHLEFRGTPPESHLSVTTVDLDAQPSPTVVLTDCQSGLDEWVARDERTGRAHPALTPNPGGDGLAVTVVREEGAWVVTTILPEEDSACPST